MTQVPVKAPTIEPDVLPQRRMFPGEVCPGQRDQVPGKIRKAFE